MNKIYQNYQTKIMVGILVLSAALLSVFAITTFATSAGISAVRINFSSELQEVTVSVDYTCEEDLASCINGRYLFKTSSCSGASDFSTGAPESLAFPSHSGSGSGQDALVSTGVSAEGKNGQYLCVEVNHSTVGVSSQYEEMSFNAPDAPTLTLRSASPNNDKTPTVRITVDSSQRNGSIELFDDAGCSNSISSSVAVRGSSKNVTVKSGDNGASVLTEGVNYIYAKHTNSVGQSTCSTDRVTYTYDGNAPNAPTALAISAVNDGVETYGTGFISTTNNTPVIQVTTAEAGGKVKLYTDSACTSAASSAVDVEGVTSPAVVDVTANALSSGSQVTYYAQHTDAAGNSRCSGKKKNNDHDANGAKLTYTYSTAPNKPTSIVLKNSSDVSRTPTFTVTVDRNHANGTVELFEGATCESSDSISSKFPVSSANVNVKTNLLADNTNLDLENKRTYHVFVEHINKYDQKICSPYTSIFYTPGVGSSPSGNDGSDVGEQVTPPSGGTSPSSTPSGSTETKKKKKKSGGSGGGVKCLACGGGAGITGPNAQAEAAGASTASVDQIALLEQQVIALMKKLIELLTDEIVVQSTAQNTRQSAPVMQNTLPTTASNLMYPVRISTKATDVSRWNCTIAASVLPTHKNTARRRETYGARCFVG